MSKFNHYARKLDEIVKAAFAKYQSAEAAFKKAERDYKALRPDIDPVTKAKKMIAREDAKIALNAAKSELEDKRQEIAVLRRELERAVAESFSADPEMLDSNTVELLKSGILTASEYRRLFDKARQESNPTMARLVAKYAGNSARELKCSGRADENTALLLGIERDGFSCSGNDYLTAFDSLISVFTKCQRSPAMIGSWGELTENVVENF